MNPLLKQIYQTKQVEDAEGNLINPFPTATPADTGEFLYELIQKHNFEKTLEIGMAYGLSTLFICQAHHDKGVGSHTAVDPVQSEGWKSIGVLNVKRAQLDDRLRFFEKRSDEILPYLLEQKERFNFAFIDGAHLFDYVLLDFFYVDKLLEVGGYIAFDDIWMPAVRKVISFVLSNRQYQIINVGQKVSLFKATAGIAHRFLSNPLEPNSLRVKLIAGNICVLKKLAKDKRDWHFHRSF